MEGQVFTFVRKGPVHWECLERELAGQAYRDADLAALLQFDRVVHEAIVAAKFAEYVAQGEEARRQIAEARRQLEALAAKLTAYIAGKVNV